MKMEYAELDLSAVVVKYRPRKQDGDLATLQSSVRRLGVLQPILVDRKNVLIVGGRRLEACRRAGLTRIPVLRLDTDNTSLEALDIQSDENLCRLPLSADELQAHIGRKKSKASVPRWMEGVKAFFRKLFGKG